MKFVSISNFQPVVNEPISEKPSKTDPFEARTVQQILSDYININGCYPSHKDDYDDESDVDEPEPNNKDLSYISDNLDLIDDFNKTQVQKSEIDSNDKKELSDENNEINGGISDGNDNVSQEPSDN